MKKLLLIVGIFALVLLPASAFADLTGTNVNAAYLFPDSGTVYGSTNVTVGAGPEITCPGGFLGGGFCNGFANVTTLDIDANSITLNEACCTSYTGASFNGQAYTLDSSFTITGFTLTDSGLSGLTDADVTFSGNEIMINLQGISVGDANGGPGVYTLTLDTIETPEPGSIFLFGSGLAGLAGIIRRKIAK